jgi:hypothetical protein
MSNALSVPTVTAAICELLQTRIAAAFVTPPPRVAPGPLDDSVGEPRVGVHLIRVTRNTALFTADLPTRTSAGEVRSKPRAAIDLHYLFTFRGNDPYQSEQLLGLCAATLHAVPELDADLIARATTNTPEVLENDLALADERVRLTPESLSLDEVSRLWALYQPGTFTVTLAAVAGPVLVDATEVPGSVLPVRQVASAARPLAGPRLDAVAGPEGVGAPVRAANPMPALQLYGAALEPQPGETLLVLLDTTPAAGVIVVGDGQLTVPLTGLGPGAHTARVQRLTAPLDASLSVTRPAMTSEPIGFTVVPGLESVSASANGVPGSGFFSGTLSATVVPPVAAPQRVRLLLDRTSPTPAVALVLEVELPLSGTPQASVSAAVPETATGVYRVTLEVDGARSLPPLDPQGRFVVGAQEVTLS